MSNKCTKCGQPLKRSNEISTHFHSHITEIARELGVNRYFVYFDALIKAVEIGEVDGGAPYPYIMIDTWIESPIDGSKIKIPALHPLPTSGRNNKQMMTAVEAAHIYAAERDITLTESCERCKGTGIINGAQCTFCEGTGKEYI